MNQAAALLLEYDDFNTFCKVNHSANTTICNIKEARWEYEKDKYTFQISADRFLRGMIRLVVGMCLNVERKKLTLQQVNDALKSKEKLPLEWSVPADGLILHNVQYPFDLD